MTESFIRFIFRKSIVVGLWFVERTRISKYPISYSSIVSAVRVFRIPLTSGLLYLYRSNEADRRARIVGV